MFDREGFGAYFDHGVDLTNRRVFIGDIEDGAIDTAIKGLYLMETESDEKPCEIFISSYGGSVYGALALYDIIKTLSCPIHTFAYGKCFSAAPLLLAAGSPGHRWVTQNTFFMTHDWAEALEGTGANLAASVKHGEQINKVWLELITSHTKQSFRWWKTKSKKASDFYFSAEQAIDWGVADHVWVEKD